MANISERQRRQMVAEAAYFRAERRGFNGGDAVADWLEAEAEVGARLHEMGSKGVLAELDERLAVANEKLGTFKKKLSASKTEVREELMRDVEKLAVLRDRLEKRLEEMRAQGEHAGGKAKEQADKVWHEISEIIGRVAARRRSRRAR